MKRVRFSSALLVFLVLAVQSAAAGSKATEAEIRAILADRIDRAEQSVGIVVGLIDADGCTVVGHGRMGPDDESVPDGDTVFEIGSITKVFTGTLLADLVRDKTLALEDTAQQHLPDSVRLPVFEGGDPITLYHLATHTSGLPRMPANFAPADPTNPYPDYSV